MLQLLLAPLLTKLAENGLSTLASAIQAKGKDFIEEKIGVKIPDNPSPAEIAQLKIAEMEYEETLQGYALEKFKAEIELEKVATAEVSKRWQADMLSDSWLSKNIRPLVLAFLLVLFFIFAVVSIFGYSIADAYAVMLGQMLQLVLGAYFVGRTVEKGIDIYQGWKQTKGE